MRDKSAHRLVRQARELSPCAAFSVRPGDSIEWYGKDPYDVGTVDSHILTLGPGLSYRHATCMGQVMTLYSGFVLKGIPINSASTSLTRRQRATSKGWKFRRGSQDRFTSIRCPLRLPSYPAEGVRPSPSSWSRMSS
jgi:hypothetical protein